MLKNIQILTFLVILFPLLNSCGTGVDARQFPPEPEKRVQKNIEEGRGFTMMGAVNKGNSGTFDFASSNELWRASLDTIDFMPLTTANYNGGIIVTDWYSEDQKIGESVKITIRFLTNEVRADALDIKIFYKKCKTVLDCEISESQGELKNELTKSILKKATLYKQKKDEENFVPYNNTKKN